MELAVTLLAPERRTELFGPGDRNLRLIRDALNVRVQARSATVRFLGEPANVAKAAAVLEKLQEVLQTEKALPDDIVESVVAEFDQAERNTDGTSIRVFTRDAVSPRTDGQREYVRAIFENDLVFCLGPAGTGKTYLAVAVAVNLLKTGRTKKIVLVRPAVEAGEKLGFLPGDLQAKVNPYLRPLLDAMHDMMTYDQLKRFMVSDIVEVIPLAYMRGRTLNNAVVILDEAQNATPSQMFMFLTRLGHNSKMIVTGDDSQVDLEPDQPSGLVDAERRLGAIDGIAIMRLNELDIVRHRLVSRIVGRYAPDGQRMGTQQSRSSYNQAYEAGANDAESRNTR